MLVIPEPVSILRNRKGADNLANTHNLRELLDYWGQNAVDGPRRIPYARQA